MKTKTVKQRREPRKRVCGKMFRGGTYGCSRPREHAGLCNGDSPNEKAAVSKEPRTDSMHPEGM